jgi:subtilisin family serine protease
MRRLTLSALLALTLGLGAFPAAAAEQAETAEESEYVVLYAEDASLDAARAAVEAAGGTVVEENTAVGVATVTTSNPSFVTDVAGQAAVDGAAGDRPVGFAPGADRSKEVLERLERLEDQRPLQRVRPTPEAPAPEADPLSGLQWDMEDIDATVQGSYATQPGDERVLVGIIDSGIDGSHPDIAPNFDAQLSRNFTTDIPLVDGPCEEEPDASCEDPADVDENGHGTHVAGTVGSPLNGLGIAGVAPNVTLVNLRAGQDSGYFFLQASVDALTYAADNGIDVVNMSFYIDPWLFNCTDNPADSPEAQLEQRTIIEATNRALDYAHARDVTLVSSMGNGATDLGNPTFDDTSPDFPPDVAYPRDIDNSCLSMPTEGNHVIGVTATGPSGRKAYYSDYGVERADVAAPGGDYNDYPGTEQYRTVDNLILAPYPASLAVANGELNPDGTPNTAFVVRECEGGTCAYYQYLQGTSMASPHAAGVAALIVSEYGRGDRDGGLRLRPARVERILERSAVDTPCPEPRNVSYVTGAEPAVNPAYDAYCEGDASFNGFYGEGLVNAQNAVTRRGF